MGQHIPPIYELPQQRVDSASVAVYHDTEGHLLLAYGLSKDYRPNLAQFKVMLSGLDPSGMLLVTTVVAGNLANDDS